MRRGPGISGIQRKTDTQALFQQKGAEVAEAELAQIKEHMQVFRANLEEFARKYKKDINKNAEFRKHFQDMCARIGVDPLASNKGFWAEVLGVGDFYYELAVAIVEVCVRTRPRNGGLIEVGELRSYLERARGRASQPISTDDIERASKTLKVLGNGFQVITVGSQKMVQSVPCELNVDHTTVIVLAQARGWVTMSALERELRWGRDRTQSILNLLLHEGMVWVDDQSETGERQFWFPSLIGGSLADA
eukprot:TRINITY_DN20286_c0_g1_i1.p2 TRINITY_DN20286_c0_g1~~TRINITY_DN20286_c0_g1_i1.p2  ORF type:complete len:248 (-),score=64.20 TRINITY_DN20286_c0_g1_i1:32-775(-)